MLRASLTFRFGNTVKAANVCFDFLKACSFCLLQNRDSQRKPALKSRTLSQLLFLERLGAVERQVEQGTSPQLLFLERAGVAFHADHILLSTDR